jgi:hypothetical protein
MRSLVRDTISLENHLRFGGIVPLGDVEGVEGVSFDRWVLVWVLLGSPFELPGVCGDPPFGCELSKGGVVDGGAADGVGGSLNSSRGLNIDPRSVGDGLRAAGVAAAPCFVVPATEVVGPDAGAEDDANGDEDDNGRNGDDDSDEVRGRTGPFPPP